MPGLALKEIFIKTLTQLLHILAILTKYLDKYDGKFKVKSSIRRVFQRASMGLLRHLRLRRLTIA
jgi:hypothetical protein